MSNHSLTTAPDGAAVKHCPRCGSTKPLTEFNRNRSKPDGLGTECRACDRAACKARYQRTKGQRKDAFLRNTYGLSLAEYDRKLADQNGGCAICAKTPEENGLRLAVDHNHRTGEVRGLLCSQCNKGIGNLGDSPQRLRQAALYLEERGHYAHP